MSQYSIEPFAPEQPEAADESAEQTIIRLMARYNLNRAVCLEMIDEVVETFGSKAGADCEADGNQLRRLNTIQGKAWKFLIEYQANQKAPDEIRMSTRVMALECGFKLAAVGLREATVAELARQCHMEKQAVNKCALTFQNLMDLARREGQRSDAARANMKTARIQQIEK